jgi:hypothetical protein
MPTSKIVFEVKDTNRMFWNIVCTSDGVVTLEDAHGYFETLWKVCIKCNENETQINLELNTQYDASPTKNEIFIALNQHIGYLGMSVLCDSKVIVWE